MIPLNQQPLPEGTRLTPGAYYGLKMAEFAGDPVMLQPYSMVQFDLPPGYVYIRATSATTYEVMTNRPEVAGEMERVNGLMPMAVNRDDADTDARPQRRHMLQSAAQGPSEAVDPNAGTSTGLMANTAEAPAPAAEPAPSTLMNPAAAPAPESAPAPAPAPAPESAGAAAAVDDGFDALAKQAGNVGKGKKQGKKD